MTRLRVLAGGKISGLFPTQLAGSDSYEWNGGVYPLKAPLEANDLRHDRKNLLSHKKFNAGPEFDVLLSPCGELDGSNTVFGEVLAGEELLLEMAQLPFVTGKSLDPSGSVASNICTWRARASLLCCVASGPPVMMRAFAHLRLRELVRLVGGPAASACYCCVSSFCL